MANPFDSQARSGKTLAAFVYIGEDKDPSPETEDYERLAALRTVDRSGSWDTDDATTRDSGKYRDNLATFIDGGITMEGVKFLDATIQRKLAKYFKDPSSVGTNTSGQPNLWIKTVERAPGTGANEGEVVDLITQYPCMITEFSDADPYDATSTFNLEFQVKATPIEEEVPDEAPAG